MYYFIYAYPASYGGLYGMYLYDLVNCNCYEDAVTIAAEMARDVIWDYRPDERFYTREDYCQEMGYDDWDDEYEDDYQCALDERVEEEVEFEIYELRDGVEEEDYSVWTEENEEPSDFIEKYCKTLTETTLNAI